MYMTNLQGSVVDYLTYQLVSHSNNNYSHML